MRRRMYQSLSISLVAVALLTALMTLTPVYGLLLRQAKKDLAIAHCLITSAVEDVTEQERATYLQTVDAQQFEGFRVTLVQPDGKVLFDSDNDPALMDNHLTRPEVARAFAVGEGEDVRRSDTMAMDTIYFAKRLEDGNVLRVSTQTRTIGAVFASILPAMMGIFILILFSSVLLSSRLTRWLLRPLDRLADDLDNTETLNGYEELAPIFEKIRTQNNLIREQVDHLRSERDTIKTITSNMQEGLVLLNLERTVLSVNRSALVMLGIKGKGFEGKHILHMARNMELGDCIDKAMKGESADVVVERAGRAYHIFANPVHNYGKICGAIVLLLDVTAQHRAEKIRRDFTANVSHELKTPLTSISGFAEMIETGMAVSPADVRKFAGRIYQEASRLITLTDDIIRLSRIEEEEGGLDVEPVDLYTVCNNVVNALQFVAAQKEVTLSLSGERMMLIGNARMLDEMLYNLIENAIKYNRPNGRVEINIRKEAEQALVCVTDTGIGIPAEHQERIFERFYRVDKSRSKQTGGTGLGLSIVKHVVERHDGSITMVSEYDKGTRVTVRLPLEQ